MSKVETMRGEGAETGRLAEAAIADPEVLAELLEGLALSNKDSSLRYACEQALLAVAEHQPALLYGHWDYFVELLKSDHSYAKVNGLYMVSALAGVADEQRVSAVLPHYLALLDDRSIMVAGHIASRAARFVRAKPQFGQPVVDALLALDATHHGPERREIVVAYAIEALGECFHLLANQSQVVEFVKGRLTSPSPRAKKAAAVFLKRHGRTKGK
jgi:hypothetical protein